MRTLSDQPARDAILEHLDDNMVVEAGAGTGKTRSLVDRVVALIKTGRANPGGIAAITFTELAAAELRARITESLEQAADDPCLPQDQRERCQCAMAELEQASIQTLHSFAGSLLGERPLAAGLPPGFTIRDEIEAEIAFENRWTAWLDAALDDPMAQQALRPALAANMTLDHMRKIADSFHSNYDLLASAPFSAPSSRDAEDEQPSELLPVLELLRCFTLDYARERRDAGQVEFLDMLVLARDLLRDSLPARDHFRERFTHILIDEMQDTDPLQAEIALFLAEEVSDRTNPNDRLRDWRKVQPAKGKLFVVGDPKQSIYRFRRADIQQVELMRQAVDGENVLLQQNFRSLSPVINWVNHIFSQWMQGEAQAVYAPLVTGVQDGRPPPVRVMGGEVEGLIGVVRRQEAEAIANGVRTAIEKGWQVRSEDEDGALRPAVYQDICVLMPRRAGFDALEIAFEEAGIPFRLESASLIYNTQEARDLLNCLAAIDDPTNPIAVVAALRSPALACSDADLLTFVENGGQFDYLAQDSPPSGCVADALAVLRKFHECRKWTAPAPLIEQFVRACRLRELALNERYSRGRWTRYGFLIDRARAFVATGEVSLRAFLAWTERQREENARARETVVRESDAGAVSVMTIHGAKGLEFPIVFLAGLNATRGPNPDPVLFDRKSGRIEAKASLQTAGYQELAGFEKTRAEEEHVRLIYVAATRARDHLVVSLYRNARGSKSAAARIEEFLQGADHFWQRFDPPAAAAPPASVSAGEEVAGDDTPAARERWQQQRRELFAARSLPISAAATHLARNEQYEKEEQDIPDEPWRRGRAGTNIGRAVHAVLQVVDLHTGSDLDKNVQAQAAAEGVPRRAGEIGRLVQCALDSSLVQRALASKRWWREAPVAGPVGEGIVEGFIDLLFEEEDGYVIVDFKTDAVGSEEEVEQAMARYRLQGGAYALALSRAAGVKVKEVWFLFLEPNLRKSVDNLPQAQEEAERAALAWLTSSPSSTH
ncbi:MAG: AAA family ATPase [Caldilineaceae bacterium SB0661_bin_32]|uniref:DNA 3'-5' helicase n=1 Tax=Caldilineaceae bacterium SB0661_bin_32 TaxID=2605255 RepID=A0A6B1D1Q2_9CHLR|nr:AAA family ATPase [Caldilineaceae bacterium SB0661_bin_32]